MFAPAMFIAAARIVAHPAAQTPPPQIDRLMLFGFVAACAALACFMEQRNSRRFVLGFAICSTLLAVFAAMTPGAWPLCLIEGVHAAVTYRRWWKGNAPGHPPRREVPEWLRAESRITRMFGSVGSEN